LHQNGRKIKLMAHPIIDKVSADVEIAGVRVVKISLFFYFSWLFRVGLVVKCFSSIIY
jgi:hypothetical protein